MPRPGAGRDGDEAVGVERHAAPSTSVWLIGVSATQYSWKRRVRQDGVALQRRRLDDRRSSTRAARSRRRARARARAIRSQLGDPAAARHVRLDEVDVAALDQLAEAPHRRVLLAGGDADVDRVGELGVRLVLVRLERLLEPVDAELLELARDADRGLRVGDVAEARRRSGCRRRRRPPSRPRRGARRASGSLPSGPQPSLTAVKPSLAQRGDALAPSPRSCRASASRRRRAPCRAARRRAAR